jgi:signal transduction histidine kinase
MIKKSFRTKLLLIYILCIVVGMIVFVMASNYIYRPLLILDVRDNMFAYSKLVTDLHLSNSVTLKRTIDMFDSSQDIQTIIYTGELDVIENSAEYIYPGSYRLDLLSEWMTVYDKNKAQDGTYFGEIEENSDNLERAVYIKKINDDTYLCMSKVVKSIDQSVNIANNIVAIGAILLIITVTVMWNGLTKSYMIQLKKMSLVTKNMSKLNFEEKINYKSDDEIGVLASSIDGMSDELKISIEKLHKDIDRRKRLIRDISHELKTPVTTVSGYAENIQILVPDNPRIQKYCNIMIEECDVINNLVQEMLYMSKLESDTFECRKEAFSVEKLSDELALRTENEFTGEKIVYSVDPAEITADINLIKRALLNYITNAVKHSADDNVVEVRGYKESEYYVFAVSNYGEEISDEEKELIWDVFYKRDESRNRSGGGHGIGLAIVKRIADLHGGKVDITSENGKNTFYLKIIR